MGQLNSYYSPSSLVSDFRQSVATTKRDMSLAILLCVGYDCDLTAIRPAFDAIDVDSSSTLSCRADAVVRTVYESASFSNHFPIALIA